MSATSIESFTEGMMNLSGGMMSRMYRFEILFYFVPQGAPDPCDYFRCNIITHTMGVNLTFLCEKNVEAATRNTGVLKKGKIR